MAVRGIRAGPALDSLAQSFYEAGRPGVAQVRPEQAEEARPLDTDGRFLFQKRLCRPRAAACLRAQVAPNIAAGGPGAGTLLPYPERPAPVPGPPELRAVIAALVASRTRVSLASASYYKPRPAFPSGDLDRSYAKPHFLPMAAELFAEHPPSSWAGTSVFPSAPRKPWRLRGCPPAVSCRPTGRSP